ncbi:hypothetical protein I4U23_013818 [Adineta vaga]|nr:hypothetical protein I4U23_013818 [Adineta vaga]
MNPLSSYHIIPAEDIVRANIRPNHILDDVRTLLAALHPISIIVKSGDTKAPGLHVNVIQKLNQKLLTLDLLKHFGYEDNGIGKYTYQGTSSVDEIATRENATKEFHEFCNDLRKIKDESSKEFKDMKNILSKRSSSRFDDEIDRDYEFEIQPPRSIPSPIIQVSSPPKLPSSSKVKEGNEKTSETIRLFKQSIVTPHGGPPAHSFIRRRLLLFLFKQQYPDSIAYGDDIINGDIDRRVEILKQKDRNRDMSFGNEIYYECLIRTKFDESSALEMLQTKRPNLQPPPEPVVPHEPSSTTLGNGVDHLQNHWEIISDNINQDETGQIRLYEGDEWKSAAHVVTAIIGLRRQHNDNEINDFAVSKMFRLIYNELCRISRNLSPVKIELIAYALYKVSLESLEHLNIIDIRDIIKSCDDREIRDDFQDSVMKLLSLECPICSGLYPRSQMETMFLCDHQCCLSCIKQYYRDTIKAIRNPESLNKLTCFQEHILDDDVRLNFFQYLGTKLNQWFTDERLVLETYHENLFIATRDSQIKKCGNPRCVGFFDNNNNNRIARVQCPHCQFMQCQGCCRKWLDNHQGISCEAYGEWLRENDPDDPEVQLMKYLDTAGMMCPNGQCKQIYEYQAGGCEHFRCPRCATEFCRICSALFYNPERNTTCPHQTCGIKNTLHAHCSLNCFRELRDVPLEQLISFLNKHKVNFNEELQQKPVANGPNCPVEGCKRAPLITCENRFCEICYKQFLFLFVWRNEIEPWELYDDNSLRQRLVNASVPVPAKATHDALIVLAEQNLKQYLGKPKQIPRIRQ